MHSAIQRRGTRRSLCFCACAGDIPEDAELYGDAVVSLWFEEFEGPYNPEASCHMCWFEGRLTCIVLSWHIPAL